MMGKLEIEVEVKSPADKFWEGIKESTTLFPKMIPQHYESVEILQGDGVNVGSVRLMKYAQGGMMPANVTFMKEKIEAMDDANKSVTYSVIDGELTTLYKNLKAKIQVVVVPKGSGSGSGSDGMMMSLVKVLVEFEKANNELQVPDDAVVLDNILEFLIKVFNDMDAYLITELLLRSLEAY